MSDGIRPTVDELRDAIAKAKSHRGYTSTFIKHTDAGAAYVRSCLPAKYHSLHCDEIRIAAQNLSRAGLEPGERTLTQEERSAKRFSSAVQSMVKAFPPAAQRSEQYEQQHSSQEWKDRVRHEKHMCGYRCQACGRQMTGDKLEGHTVRYDAWRQHGMVLIVCRECHPVLDALRRRGAIQDNADHASCSQLFQEHVRIDAHD